MNSFYSFQGMGFFRLQSKLVYPPSSPRMVSIGERSSPPENFGNVQNSGEIPDIIKRRKGLIYQSI